MPLEHIPGDIALLDDQHSSAYLHYKTWVVAGVSPAGQERCHLGNADTTKSESVIPPCKHTSRTALRKLNTGPRWFDTCLISNLICSGGNTSLLRQCVGEVGACLHPHVCQKHVHTQDDPACLEPHQSWCRRSRSRILIQGPAAGRTLETRMCSWRSGENHWYYRALSEHVQCQC